MHREDVRVWSGRASRRIVATATVLAVAAFTACYQFVPTGQTVFPVGTSVAFELNDAGRLSVANKIGSEVLQITGTLIGQTGTDYTLGVTSITFLNGRTAQWSGEAVTIRQESIKSLSERKFSPARTAVAVIASTGVVGATLLATNLNGSGDTTTPTTKPPPGGTAFRAARLLSWTFRLP
jgi:hypothetical protein